jgi:hypothetical protein
MVCGKTLFEMKNGYMQTNKLNRHYIREKKYKPQVPN